MLDFEKHDYQPQPMRRRVAPQNYHPIATVGAALMLALGAVFGRIAAFCNAVAQKWTDPATVRAWSDAVAYCRGLKPGARQPKAVWEQRLVWAGSSVLLGIGGTLIVFWLLLLLGGSLAWLVAQGFGFVLLLFAVLVGAIIGSYHARLGSLKSNNERLN